MMKIRGKGPFARVWRGPREPKGPKGTTKIPFHFQQLCPVIFLLGDLVTFLDRYKSRLPPNAIFLNIINTYTEKNPPKHCLLLKYSETCEPIFDNQPSEQIVQKQTEVFPFWTLFCQNVQNHAFDPLFRKAARLCILVVKAKILQNVFWLNEKLLNCGKFKIPRHSKIPPNLKRLSPPLFTTSISELLRFNIHQKSNGNMTVQHY